MSQDATVTVVPQPCSNEHPLSMLTHFQPHMYVPSPLPFCMLLNTARAMLSAERRALAVAARAEAVHLARAYTSAKKNGLLPSDVSTEGSTSEGTRVSVNNQTAENTLSHMSSRDDVMGGDRAPDGVAADVSSQTVVAEGGVAYMSDEVGGGANGTPDETPSRSEDSIPSEDNTATPTVLGNDDDTNNSDNNNDIDNNQDDASDHPSNDVDAGPTTMGAEPVDGVVSTPPSTLHTSMDTDGANGSAIDAASSTTMQPSLHGDPDPPGVASEVPVTADVIVDARIASAEGATSEVLIASTSVQTVAATALDGE